MAKMTEHGTVEICIRITVHVDPTNVELLYRIDQSSGPFSLINVVRSEVESNLESMAYVQPLLSKLTFEN